jgi:hypothetical protein
MEVAVLEIKRTQMIESLTRHIKWARPLFFALQNAIRLELMRRYHSLKRWYGTSKRISRTYPCATAPLDALI